MGGSVGGGGQGGEEGRGMKVVKESQKKGEEKQEREGNRSFTGERKQAVKGVNSRRQRGRSS